MRTIAVIARKGGSGKTTLATHLALAGHLRGRSVVLADADPQRSSTETLRLRTAPGPRVIETSGPKLFALKVASMREGADLLVIDTPAGPRRTSATRSFWRTSPSWSCGRAIST